jgi:purine-binding chemotaxis protein CheW
METMMEAVQTQAGNSAEYLVFTLGKEEYGIDILKVQEIRGYDHVTGIANTPVFIKGVINLRGIIVPIVDLRIKFDLGEPTYDQFTVVIILNVARRVADQISAISKHLDELMAQAVATAGKLKNGNEAM